MHLFCFGFGYVAKHFALYNNWYSVTGTHKTSFPLSLEMQTKLKNATHILYSIPPVNNLDNICSSYEMNPKWLGYLSTTGVYGNTNGNWVDENSALKPDNERCKKRIEAENIWFNINLPINIYRLSGIYGVNRNAIEDLKLGTAKRIYKENQYFSRIHVEDICQILTKSFHIRKEVFNCADDLPCSAAEVVEYAAKLIKIKPPSLINYQDANLSEMAKSFYSSSRRVRNDKIKNLLGIKLKFPSYKEGLLELLNKQNISV